MVVGPELTNASGVVTRRVVLRNGGPFTLEVMGGTKLRMDDKWKEPGEGGQIVFESESHGSVVAPGRGLQFELRPPPHTNSWRLEVQCRRYYDRNTRLGRWHFAFDSRVRKRDYIETFCSDEMKP